MVEFDAMFLYIPYSTDAPVYYRPIITIAMIVINVLVFVMFTGEQIEPYMLAIGAGLLPEQWLTTNFLHADIFHLVFNMLFLWVFGLIVEGKLGPIKMLVTYLTIGILYGAAVQILLLNHEPTYCLGASAVIFGLAVMSLLWAPENRIHALLIVWIFIIFRSVYLETKISILVGIFLALDITKFYFLGGGLSSELLHLIGAVIGFIVGIAMLKTNFVDCEHWDILSVWSGENLLSDEERNRIEKNKPESIKRRAEARQKRQHLLAEEIELALQNQTPLPAFVITQRIEREYENWTLPQESHLTMIRQLLTGKHWTEAIASMRQYLDRHQEQSVFVRLMLIQALLVQNLPKNALEVLNSVSPDAPEQRSAIPKIRAKAEAMHRKNIEEGFYETDA